MDVLSIFPTEETRVVGNQRVEDGRASNRFDNRAGRADSTEVLRQSEERFRLMVDAVTDYAIFMLDPDGLVSTWNDGAERIKGYTDAEIIGRHFSVFYPPDALAKDWPAYELKVASLEGHFEDEGWRVRKDGSLFWANVVITALRTEDGRLIGFTKVTRDLTERRRHEDALRHSEKRLEKAYLEVSQRNNELQEFTRAASHDLQEPLRKLRTFAELLQDEEGEHLSESGRLYVDRISNAAARMSDLVSDLLSYSRLTNGTRPIETVDLNRTIDDVINDLQVRIDETGGRIEVGKLPSLVADPVQMRQLFQNLIGNALKFQRPGTAPVVRVAAKDPASDANGDGESFAIIRVEDNGIGFEGRFSEVIFSPFHRLYTRSEYEGTGLGLSICRRIVERHHGTIAATSVPGQGATFEIRLPLRRPGAQRPAGTQP